MKETVQKLSMKNIVIVKCSVVIKLPESTEIKWTKSDRHLDTVTNRFNAN